MRSRLLHPVVLLSLLSVAAMALAWWAGSRPADPGALLERLVPGHRPLLGRVSLAVPHAPHDPAAPTAGPEEREAIFAALLAARVQGRPGAAAALAAYYVARNEPGDAERALATADDPVDRGAVLLALDRPDEALEELAAALRRRPGDPAALFDRALALEALLLDGQAQEAWSEFLAVEDTGGWAEEARRRKDSPRTVPRDERSLDVVKRDAVLALLAARGPEALEPIRPDAAALAEVGDELIDRTVAYLDGLNRDGWRARLEEVRLFELARARVSDGRDAGDVLERLAASADPLIAVKSLHFIAYGALLRQDAGSARAALNRLRDRCRQVGCSEEVALVASDLGNLHHQRSHYQAAARAYEEGARMLPAGFRARRAEILHKMAVVERDQGAPGKAVGLLREALRMNRESGARALPRALDTAADLLMRLGRPAAAEAFGREALELAIARGEEAHALWIAREQAQRLGRWGRQGEAIDLLRRTIDRFRDTKLELDHAAARTLLAEVLLEAGRLEEAEASAREAAAIDRDGSLEARRRLLEVEGRIARAAGQPGRAIDLLKRAVAIDRTVADLATDPIVRRRAEFEGAERRLLLAGLLGEAGDFPGALEAFLGAAPASPDPGECRIGLARVEDRLLAFSASEAGIGFDSRPLSAAALERAVADAKRGESGPLAAAIGSVWGPSRCPETATRIAILEPPGALAAPLPALVRRERPEAVVGVAVFPGSRWPGKVEGGKALLVRDPLLPPDEALPRLPGTDREAAALRRLRPDLGQLRGVEATPAAVGEHAAGATLLHFAVHGLARRGHGPSSYLALAGEEGHLGVAEVLGLNLQDRAPVVVLSACSTAGLPEDLENDASGLPWAFLEAGARAVIASFDAIEDEAAAEFSTTFYRLLGDGASVPEAAAAASRSRRGMASGGSFVLYF